MGPLWQQLWQQLPGRCARRVHRQFKASLSVGPPAPAVWGVERLLCASAAAQVQRAIWIGT
jgi:hypothetical protein